jgi:hypothetical protein
MIAKDVDPWALLAGQNYMVVTLASFIFWCVVGLLCSLVPIPADKKKFTNDIHNRLPSMIHSSFTIIVGGYRLFFTEINIEAPNLLLDEICCCFSCGYFMFDSLSMIFLNLMEPAIGVHHLAGIMCYFPILYTGYGGCITLCSFLWTEIGNPSMHARIILKQWGLRHTKLYEVLEVFYITTYMFCRGIMWSPIVWASVFSTNIPKITAYAGVFLLFQSYHFMTKMVKILTVRYAQY